MSDVERELAEARTRLDKIESQISFLLRRLNIPAEELPAWNAPQTVIDLLKKGDGNGAIGAFMDETACSLKDAKRYVESIRV
jgi:hypothetical protein